MAEEHGDTAAADVALDEAASSAPGAGSPEEHGDTAAADVALDEAASSAPGAGSPEEFEAWVAAELRASPLCEQGFSPLAERTVEVAAGLRRRLDKGLWLRLLRGGRMFKELNEALPVVQRVLALVEAAEASDGEAITIVDLCSGIGYLSILLAELLRGSSKVARFVLVDSRWPMLNAEAQPHHINPMHLQGGLWPFELAYRKYDLKSSSGQRQLQEHIVAQAPGPVALLGVHLCGVLSLHAVQFFNDHPRCTFLALKPCCLPPWTLARQEYVWTLGGHTIPAADVCAPGTYVRSRWTGPQRKSAQGAVFRRWASHLLEAIDAGELGHKELADFELVRVPEGQEPRYQTLFAFAERAYGACTGAVRGIGGEPPPALRPRGRQGRRGGGPPAESGQ